MIPLFHRFAILGHPVSHSLSPKFHNAIFRKKKLHDHIYEYCDTPRKKLSRVLGEMREGKWRGFSVTIPYKEAVIPYLDKLSPLARKVGAVNTIIRQKDGTLFGDNTDYIGFKKCLEDAHVFSISSDSPTRHKGSLGMKKKNALVLGTGGASKAAIAVLKDMGWKVTVASRTKKRGVKMYVELKPDDEFRLVVNTTPVGMSPDVDRSPLNNPKWFKKDRIFMDVIYAPKMTKFLKLAKRSGAKIITGDRMFYWQAMEQSKMFTQMVTNPLILFS